MNTVCLEKSRRVRPSDSPASSQAGADCGTSVALKPLPADARIVPGPNLARFFHLCSCGGAKNQLDTAAKLKMVLEDVASSADEDIMDTKSP